MTTATMNNTNTTKPVAKLLPSIASSPEHFFIKLHLTTLSRYLKELLQPERVEASDKDLDPRFFFTNRGKDGKLHKYTFEHALNNLGVLPELRKRAGFEKLRKDRAWWAAASYVEHLAKTKQALKITCRRCDGFDDYDMETGERYDCYRCGNTGIEEIAIPYVNDDIDDIRGRECLQCGNYQINCGPCGNCSPKT